jgi:hypothetical protein
MLFLQWPFPLAPLAQAIPALPSGFQCLNVLPLLFTDSQCYLSQMQPLVSRIKISILKLKNTLVSTV